MSAGLFDVQGLIAVVTGGGTGTFAREMCRDDGPDETDTEPGIGLMLAQALASHGATVYIIGRRSDVLDAAALTEVRGQVSGIVASSWARMVQLTHDFDSQAAGSFRSKAM